MISLEQMEAFLAAKGFKRTKACCGMAGKFLKWCSLCCAESKSLKGKTMSDDFSNDPDTFLVDPNAALGAPTKVSTPVANQENWVEGAPALEAFTDNVIPFKASEVKEPKCSFCGTPKSQTKFKFLVTSPLTGHTICPKCVEISTQRLNEDELLRG